MAILIESLAAALESGVGLPYLRGKHRKAVLAGHAASPFRRRLGFRRISNGSLSPIP
jgi:hypothetical protein